MYRLLVVAGCALYALCAHAVPAQTASADAFTRGRAAYYDAKFDESTALLEHAVTADSTNAVYWDWLGRAYCAAAEQAGLFSRIKLAHRCRDAFERAVALDSTNLTARADRIRYYAQAPGAAGGDRKRARRLAAAFETYAPYAGGLSTIALCQSDQDTACWRQEADKLLTTFPDSSGGYEHLALYYTEGKQFDSAFALLDRRLATHAADWASLYQVGRTGAVSGRHLDRAEDALKQYLGSPAAQDPDQRDKLVGAHYRLGMVYAGERQSDSARAEYRAALALDPANDLVKRALHDLH